MALQLPDYRQLSNIRRTKSPNLHIFLVLSCSCLCPIHWSQVLSREWRCSWNSAEKRCSIYIWMINNVIAHYGASYIRDLTVVLISWILHRQPGLLSRLISNSNSLPHRVAAVFDSWPAPTFIGGAHMSTHFETLPSKNVTSHADSDKPHMWRHH